jgi:hypothetical protein
MADPGHQITPERIRQIRIGLGAVAALFVLWWVVEFITYPGRAGGADAFDFVLAPIAGFGGWLVYRAWRAACPQCGNPFFVNRGLPLGFHFSTECPYCGFDLSDLGEPPAP